MVVQHYISSARALCSWQEILVHRTQLAFRRPAWNEARSSRALAMYMEPSSSMWFVCPEVCMDVFSGPFSVVSESRIDSEDRKFHFTLEKTRSM